MTQLGDGERWGERDSQGSERLTQGKAVEVAVPAPALLLTGVKKVCVCVCVCVCEVTNFTFRPANNS